MNERLAEITAKLTKHIHDVVLEYNVTEEEWKHAIDFLTEVGKKDEFILLSDVLGISVLVNDVTHTHDHHDDVSVHNVEGPLYRENAPLVETPAKLADLDEVEEPLVMSGKVVSADGKPIKTAIVDVWQTNEAGEYENQDPTQKEFNFRRRIKVDGEGNYLFYSCLPGPYEIGKGGPVGELLKAVDRHAWRPAHIHFKITAEGYKPLTTMLFLPNDPWIDSDAINAVKKELILDLEKTESTEDKEKFELDRAFYKCQYDFKLMKED